MLCADRAAQHADSRLVSKVFSTINIGVGVNCQLKTGFIGGDFAHEGADICQDVNSILTGLHV